MSLLFLFGPAGEEAPVVVDTNIAYILNGINIRSPHRMTEENSTQYAQNRVLPGDINRDFFGDNKRVWILEYYNLNFIDYTIIKSIYDDYLNSAEPATWEVTGENYSVDETIVHVDLPQRQFNNTGVHYLSDFTLTLTET